MAARRRSCSATTSSPVSSAASTDCDVTTVAVRRRVSTLLRSAVQPVAGSATRVRHSQYLNDRFAISVDDGKWEPAHQKAPRSDKVRWYSSGRLGNRLYRGVQGTLKLACPFRTLPCVPTN